MKNFLIYTHPDGRSAAVKDGWNWPAALFSTFWALYHRMWLIALVPIGIGLAIGFVYGFATGISTLPNGVGVLINVIVTVLFGVKAKEWRLDHLESRGYTLFTVTRAANHDQALANGLRLRGATS